MMISASCVSHYAMSPWFTIFVLDSYCRPYRERKWVFLSIINLNVFIFACFQDLIVFVIIIKIGLLFIWHNRALIGLLNKSVAGLGSPAPIGVDLICHNARFMSTLLSRHLLMVCFTSFMPASTCPLLWWWCDEVMACCIFSYLQYCFNLCDMMFVPASDTSFLRRPNSVNTILATLIISSAERQAPFFTTVNML